MSKPYIRFDYQAFTSIYTFVLEIPQNKPITSTINQNFFLQRRDTQPFKEQKADPVHGISAKISCYVEYNPIQRIGCPLFDAPCPLSLQNIRDMGKKFHHDFGYSCFRYRFCSFISTCFHFFESKQLYRLLAILIKKTCTITKHVFYQKIIKMILSIK